MKKLLPLLLLSALSLPASANELLYKPTDKEKEAFEYFIKDEVEIFFSEGQSLFGDENKDKYRFITPEKIQKEYDDNEVRADKNFKGKLLIISGTVDKIQSGVKDEPFVVFKTKQMFQSPQARFIESEFDKVIELNKGGKISLVCIGAGEVAGTPLLKNCKFKKTVISDYISEYMTAYNDLLKGKVNPEQNILNQVVFFANVYQYITNDFSKCTQGKFKSDCFEKSIDKKKEKENTLERVRKGDIPEKFKPLYEYLHLK